MAHNGPHEPTDDKKNLVSICAGLGMTQEKMARMLHITVATLKYHYWEELETGRAKVDAMVYSKLMENINKGKEASIIFYLKARCNWRETSVVEVDGLPPVLFNISFGEDPPAALPPTEQAKLNALKLPVIGNEPTTEG